MVRIVIGQYQITNVNTGDEDDEIIDGSTASGTISTGAGDDTITSYFGTKVIDAGAGDDTVEVGGYGANHTVTLGEGDDTLIYKGGDSLTVTDFNPQEDTLDLAFMTNVLSFGDLTIEQDGENTVIDLDKDGGGKITLQGVDVGALSADAFDFYDPPEGQEIQGDEGTGGNDTITGTDGFDWIDGKAGDDVIYAGDDNDLVFGGTGDDTIYGGAGDDILNASVGDDTVYGGEGDDRIYGAQGDDTLSGDAGDDTLSGGTGVDTFVYAAGDGDDTITDFTDGEDTIDLTAITDITGFGDLTITTEGTNAVVDLSAHGGGTIILEDFDASNLDASDFEFHTPPAVEAEPDAI